MKNNYFQVISDGRSHFISCKNLPKMQSWRTLHLKFWTVEELRSITKNWNYGSEGWKIHLESYRLFRLEYTRSNRSLIIARSRGRNALQGEEYLGRMKYLRKRYTVFKGGGIKKEMRLKRAGEIHVPFVAWMPCRLPSPFRPGLKLGLPWTDALIAPIALQSRSPKNPFPFME